MKKGRVLLADAHLNMLVGVHSLLESLFESVVMVADEKSLMAALATFEPDLAIVDVSLPVVNGENIALRLRKSYPKLRLIVLSIHDEPALARQLLANGIAGVVLKRTAATDLLPAIREIRKGGTYVSQAMQADPAEDGRN